MVAPGSADPLRRCVVSDDGHSPRLGGAGRVGVCRGVQEVALFEFVREGRSLLPRWEGGEAGREVCDVLGLLLEEMLMLLMLMLGAFLALGWGSLLSMSLVLRWLALVLVFLLPSL